MRGRKAKNQVLPADAFSPNCPSRAVLDHVTSKWGVLVLAALVDKTLRFGELRKRVGGVSEKMLAQTLVGLERDGLVTRTAHAVIPPRVDYTLTVLGRALALRMEDLVRFIEEHLPQVTAAQKRHDGHP